jgi:chromosome segregation ATPase
MTTNKDAPVTFEELYRLLQERDRFIKQKDDSVSKLQQLTTDIEKIKMQLERHQDSISSVENKIKVLGAELGKK